VVEDDGLIYYLKHGKQLGGLPKKQHKRICKLANHIKFDNNKMLYRKNANTLDFLIYPRPDENNEILLPIFS